MATASLCLEGILFNKALRKLEGFKRKCWWKQQDQKCIIWTRWCYSKFTLAMALCFHIIGKSQKCHCLYSKDRWPEIWYILNSSCKSSHCCQYIKSVTSTWRKSTFYCNFYSAKIMFILKKFLTFQENAPYPSKPRNIFEVHHVGKN